MFVQMIVDTHYDGFKKVGEQLEVREDVAKRWISRGIAFEVVQEVKKEEKEKMNYSVLKSKELYDLCIERNIEAEQKQQKEVYIQLLEELDMMKELEELEKDVDE